MTIVTASFYHSVVALDPRRYRSQHDVHRLLWKGFPGIPKPTEPGTPQPFTFRKLELVHKVGTQHRPLYLVQSHLLPEWPEDDPDLILKQPVNHHELALPTGGTFAYRLIAAPLKAICGEVKGKSRKVALLGAKPIWEWFERRSAMAGFRVFKHTSNFTKENTREFKYNSEQNEVASCQILTKVQFDGELEVIDPQLLKQALERGFSNRKSFGYGMLNVLPIG